MLRLFPTPGAWAKIHFEIPGQTTNIRLPLERDSAFRAPCSAFEMKRTHHCNELRAEHIGQTVTLTGWVHSKRDLGGVNFIDIRDREGRTQTVFDPQDVASDVCELASTLHSESVIEVTGKVRQRPAGTNNDKIPTGQIEVQVSRLWPISPDSGRHRTSNPCPPYRLSAACSINSICKSSRNRQCR